MLSRVNWPTAVVALGGLILLGLVSFFGKDIGLTDAAHAQVLAALGTVGSLVLAFMKEALRGEEPEKDEKDEG